MKITKKVLKTGTIVYQNENGLYHNENGDPAVIWWDGSKRWCKNGLSHNEDGPAYISPTRSIKYWCLDGKHYSESEWKNEVFKRCFKP